MLIIFVDIDHLIEAGLPSVNEERRLRDFANSNSRTRFDIRALAREILSVQASLSAETEAQSSNFRKHLVRFLFSL